MERGEFDDLPGKGKPIDLDAYFSTPEDLRMAFSILKSNEFVPEEVEIFREIADIKEKMNSTDSDTEKAQLSRRLHDRNLALSLLLDKRRRR